MHFLEWFNSVIHKRGIYLSAPLIRNVSVFSAAVFGFCLWYLSLSITSSAWVIVDEALIDAGMILVGLSCALSGLCFFWDFVDTKIIYRKYLGLAGMTLTFCYILLTSFLYFGSRPESIEEDARFDFDHLWDVAGIAIPNSYTAVLIVTALLLYIAIAAISNQHTIHELGGVRWRKLLRYGSYSGLILSALFLLIHSFSNWQYSFFLEERLLPPLSFVVFLFVVFTLGLRISLWYALKKKEALAQLQQPPTVSNA